MTYIPPSSGLPQWDAVPAPAPVDQPLVFIGDVQLTANWLVTPAGSVPLKGTDIMVVDYTRFETKIPTWAVVLAIVGFFVVTFFSLFFLLAKENVSTGYVQVTFRNGNLVHTTAIPSVNLGVAQDVNSRVNYARHLISVASR